MPDFGLQGIKPHLLKKTNLWCDYQRSSFQLVFEFCPGQRKEFFIAPSRPLPVKNVGFVDDSGGLGKVWRQRVRKFDESLAAVPEVTCAYGQVETLTTGSSQLKLQEPKNWEYRH